MAFDYKKEYKEFYLPPRKPGIIEIPQMNYLAVRGEGDPNEENGEYSRAVGLLYGMAYTIKMSYKGSRKIDGFFEYIVPPLEGFWWQDNVNGVDYAHKESFNWISLIRLPDFVKRADFEWAVDEAARKKKSDFSGVEFFAYHEGLCVQCMHIGSYDDEPATVLAMDSFARENGYEVDISDNRYHHEIYLIDPRKTNPAKLKTVIRHPIKKVRKQFMAKNYPHKLILRPLYDNDIALMERWLYTPHVAQWYKHPDHWLNELRERRGEFSFLTHFIAEFEGVPIGFCQYYDCFYAQQHEVWNDQWRVGDGKGEIFSIDYLIGEPEYLGRGFGKEMIAQMLDMLRKIGAKTVIAEPERDNTASNRALEANGFIWNSADYHLDLGENRR